MAKKEIKYEIVKSCVVLEEYSSGWTKELNVVKWNDGEPKYDIRNWNPDHTKMTGGVTLIEDDIEKIADWLECK